MALEHTPATELPADYYHQNFCELLRVVQRRYGDLLSEAERGFIARFHATGHAAQCLYVRLANRRHDTFRLGKLRYAEIPDLAAAARELEGAGLLALDPPLALEALLPLFTKAELLAALAPAGGAKLSRPALEQQLLDGDTDAHRATLQDLDTLLQLLQAEHLVVFRLCFFGNLHQDLTDFVLRDLALQRYEDYSLDPDSRQFSDRQQLQQHLQFHACSETREEALALGREGILALEAALPSARAEDAALARRVDRLRNALARELERLGEPQAALALYQRARQPPARERRARILMSGGETDASLGLCREILERPADEAELAFAQQFGQRHAARHGHNWPASPRHQPPQHQLELPAGDGVEAAVARHLGDDGDCFYVENALFSGVLGLAIWPALFAPVRGAFSHPFQNRPHDFHQRDFARDRAALIAAELGRQRDDPEAFQHALQRRLADKRGIANPLVNWSVLEPPLLTLALQRIPATHWQRIFARLLDDLRLHRSGLPDLIHFPAAGGYALVEVKGPGDRLQDNQRRWMQFFAEHEIPHWVAQVRWSDGD